MDPDDDMDVEAFQHPRGLARLALFSEHKHIPLRHEDINKKGIHSFHPTHPSLK